MPANSYVIPFRRAHVHLFAPRQFSVWCNRKLPVTAYLRHQRGTVFACYKAWKSLSPEEHGYWAMVARTLNKEMEEERQQGHNLA